MILRSNVQVCDGLIPGIAVSNPAERIDVCISCLLCVVQVAACARSRARFRRNPIARARVYVCVFVCLIT